MPTPVRMVAVPHGPGSDVTPVRTPSRTAACCTEAVVRFRSSSSAPSVETPSGDILTSFRTSITHPQPGIALDDYHYQLQTIVGGMVQPVPNLDVGTCRYQDPPYGSVTWGPTTTGRRCARW